MKIDYFSLKLDIEKKNIQPYNIRNFIGRKFKEYILLHHHIDSKKYLYRYPLVQYKKINSDFYIIGLDTGAIVLKEIWDKFDSVDINGNDIKIYEKELIFKQVDFKVTQNKQKYKFVTPWIALNKENYQIYKSLNDKKEINSLLSKILTGNILSCAKGFDIVITEKIDLNIINYIKTRTVTIKKTPLIGFTLNFYVNIQIPDLIGLGKSVSRGFGSIITSCFQ